MSDEPGGPGASEGKPPASDGPPPEAGLSARAGRGDAATPPPDVAIRPLASDAEAEACARMMAASEPWITLKRGFDASLRILRDESKERYVALAGSTLAGFLILNMKGAFVGYVQTVCAAPAFRGRGVGTALMAFAERRIFRESPNVFLCVSSFNPGARRLYERLGYVLVGELADFLVTGHAEMLYRKTMGPILGFTPMTE